MTTFKGPGKAANWKEGQGNQRQQDDDGNNHKIVFEGLLKHTLSVAEREPNEIKQN